MIKPETGDLNKLILRLTNQRDSRSASEQTLNEIYNELLNLPPGGIGIDFSHRLITTFYTKFAKQWETYWAYRELSRIAVLLSRLTAPRVHTLKFQKRRHYPRGKKILFIIDTDFWLGHLQVLCSFIEIANKEERDKIEVIAFNGRQESVLDKKLERFSVKYSLIQTPKVSEKLKLLESYVEKISKKGYETKLIWTAWPPLMFIGSVFRLADRQACWAMKYPAPMGHQCDEIYYPYGFDKKTTGVTYMHDSSIKIITHPFYLTKDALSTNEEIDKPKQKSKNTLSKLKALKDDGKLVIACIARPEKMNNLSFINRLKNLLAANKYANFVWCGRKGDESSKIFQKSLEMHDISDRCTFLGWVNPWDTLKNIDYFLDTHPFGSGITLAQALRLQKNIILHRGEPFTQDLQLEDCITTEPNFSAVIRSEKATELGYFVDLDPMVKESYLLIQGNQKPCHEIKYNEFDIFAPSQAVHTKISQLLLS